MIADSVKGAGYLIQGLGLLTTPGVKRFVAIPLTINILLFAGLIWFGYSEFMDFLNWLLPEENGWLGWLRYILIPLFFLTVLVIVFFTFTIVANIISSPFNGLLAEAVEKHLTGQEVGEPKGFMDILKNALPMMLNELRKSVYYAMIIIPAFLLFLVLSFIPVVNILGAIGWFLVSAWILAVEYNDFPFDNHDIPFREMRRQLGMRKWLAFGFGGATMIATAIPVVNFFVMPSAVAGATAMSVQQKLLPPARPAT
ncbi:MAG: sulfate transporter CysZ [Granulosicoccaceae bacterium]